MQAMIQLPLVVSIAVFSCCSAAKQHRGGRVLQKEERASLGIGGPPSVTVMANGAITTCPVGSLAAVGPTKAAMTVEQCAMAVQNAKADGTCGNIYVVRTAVPVPVPVLAPGSNATASLPTDGLPTTGLAFTHFAAPAPASASTAACACCPPVPTGDCVNCLAGSTTIGWQTRPATVEAPGLTVMRLTYPTPKAAGCSTRSFASWGAFAAYRKGLQAFGGPRPRDMNFAYMMQTAFWKNVGSWSPLNVTESDNAGLWDKDGHCILSFRGSDSTVDFANNGQVFPVVFHGLQGVYGGVTKEFTAVFDAMKAGNGTQLLQTTCAKSLTVSGHSLGGALAQLFAVLANKVGDPLMLGVEVTRVYGFGSMPVGLTEFRDDKSLDGCFTGGLYFNMQKDSSGTSYIDILSHMGTAQGFTWAKTAKVLSWNYTSFEVVSCGQPMPTYPGLPPGYPALSPGQFALHDAAAYADNIDCVDNSGLKEKKVESVDQTSPVGVLLKNASAIAQCPIGTSISLMSGQSMSAEQCAAMVRTSKVNGVCGDIYSVKVTTSASPSTLTAPSFLAHKRKFALVSPSFLGRRSLTARQPPRNFLSVSTATPTGTPVITPVPTATPETTDAPVITPFPTAMPETTATSETTTTAAPTAAAVSVCSCCSPVPVTDCVSCLAGSGDAGWQTSPSTAPDSNWRSYVLADTASKASTCSTAAQASWASMAAYASSPMVAMMFVYLPNYQYMMKSAFWHVTASFTAVNNTRIDQETDHTELWVRGGDCMLSFRGSDSASDMHNNALYFDNATYHGLMLHTGIRIEWQFLLQKLQTAGAFATIQKNCAKPLTVVGHSLGAAMAQVFAVMANKLGDPLLMGLEVGSLYGFGAMPIGHEGGAPSANGKSADGCFAGGVYGNAAHKSDGTSTVDPAFTMLMSTGYAYRHVKTTTIVMFSPTEKTVIPCGTNASWWTQYTPDPSGLMPLHDFALYSNNLGC